MSETMRAYRMTGWGEPPAHTEVPVPEPGPGEVLVRVAGCGLCRSDLTMRQMPRAVGERLGWRMPFTLGHETAGWVAATGPGAGSLTAAGPSTGSLTAAGPSTGSLTAAGPSAGGPAPAGAGAGALSEGTPVALVSPTSCGSCWHCTRGLDNSCPHGLAGRGYGRDGGLAEYVLVSHARGVLPLGGLDPRHAGTLTDAGATAYHAVRRALPRVVPGGTAVVLGAGGLGAFAVQFLRLLTAARVVAVDPDPTRRAYAGSVGAHETLSGVDDDGAKPLRRLGADAVLDFVGTDATIAAGIAAVRPGGAYGLIGSAGGRLDRPWFGTLPRDGEVFTFQGSTIADAQEVIALAAAGLIHNQVEEFPFDKAADAYERLATGTLTGRAVVLLS